MTPEQYQLCLHRLDLTQAEAGDFLRISTRTSCGYANGHSPVPAPTAMLLGAMVDLNLKPEDFDGCRLKDAIRRKLRR